MNKTSSFLFPPSACPGGASGENRGDAMTDDEINAMSVGELDERLMPEYGFHRDGEFWCDSQGGLTNFVIPSHDSIARAFKLIENLNPTDVQIEKAGEGWHCIFDAWAQGHGKTCAEAICRAYLIATQEQQNG